MLDFSQFEYLSFDCYGTLVDWETGILGYVRPLLRKKGLETADAEILNAYSVCEPQRQEPPYHSYRDVLAGVMWDLAARFKCEISDPEAAGLADSIANWEPFPDTKSALERLKSRYKLAVLSNIDDELFAFSASKLGVTFDCVVTAEQIQSYKPSLRNFETLLQRLSVDKNRLLHVAESLYHDVVPAQQLGLATVWVNRRQGKAAAASRLIDARADVEVPDVGTLADLTTG
jgi:2-haloacid dehalogenase